MSYNPFREGERAHFANITPARRRLPSWVVKQGRAAAIVPSRVELRAAGVPADLARNDATPTDAPPAPEPPAPRPPHAPPPMPEREVEHEVRLESPPPPMVEYVVDEEATQAFVRAAEALMAARDQLARASEHQLLELVRAIAKRVIARELELDASIVKGLVEEGLAALVPQQRVTIRLGVGFAPASGELVAMLSGRGFAEPRVLVDETLELWGCQVEADLGRVDESVTSRLSILLTALAGNDDAEERGT